MNIAYYMRTLSHTWICLPAIESSPDMQFPDVPKSVGTFLLYL
jgi:hypothetical protein